MADSLSKGTCIAFKAYIFISSCIHYKSYMTLTLLEPCSSVSCTHLFIKYVGYNVHSWILHNKSWNICIKSKWSQVWVCVISAPSDSPNATAERKLTAFKLVFWTLPLSAIDGPDRQLMPLVEPQFVASQDAHKWHFP